MTYIKKQGKDTIDWEEMQVITFAEDEIIPEDFIEKATKESIDGVIRSIILHYTDENVKHKKRIKELECYNQLTSCDKQQLIETILLRNEEIDRLKEQIKWYESI